MRLAGEMDLANRCQWRVCLVLSRTQQPSVRSKCRLPITRHSSICPSKWKKSLMRRSAGKSHLQCHLDSSRIDIRFHSKLCAKAELGSGFPIMTSMYARKLA